jgi:hypothetical protein
MAVCTQSIATAQSASVKDSALRAALLAAQADEDSLRDAAMAEMRGDTLRDSVLTSSLARVDNSHFGLMRRTIQHYGWPGRSLAGDDGEKAAFLIVQHNSHLELMVLALKALRRAVAAGDAPGKHYAYLYDRVAVLQGRPQRYGTQAKMTDGKLAFAPIADSAGVDERRARLGMPSLAAYARILDSAYASHTP